MRVWSHPHSMSLAASHQQLLQTRLAAGLCKQHSQAPRRVHCKALASSLASLQTPVLQTAEQPDAAGPAAAECSRSPQDSTQEVQALPFSVVSFYRLVDLHAPQEVGLCETAAVPRQALQTCDCRSLRSTARSSLAETSKDAYTCPPRASTHSSVGLARTPWTMRTG